MKSRRVSVPHEIVAKLRLVCLDLPEAYEEEAWVGTRWMVVKKNFAHVLMIDAGWPPAYARAAGSDGPLCVLDAHTDWDEVAALLTRSYCVLAPKKLVALVDGVSE